MLTVFFVEPIKLYGVFFMRLIVLCFSTFLFLMSPIISASNKNKASLWDSSEVTFNRFLKCQVFDQKRLEKGFKIGSEIEVAYNSLNGEIWAKQKAIQLNNKGKEISRHGVVILDEGRINFSFNKILIIIENLNYDNTTRTDLMLPIDRSDLTVAGAIIRFGDRANFSGECSPVDFSEAFEWTQIDRQI